MSGLLWTYDTGKLELTTDDSSKLVLNADNDDPASVTVEIIDSNGNGETVVQRWSLWEDSLRFEFDITNTWFP